MKNHKHIASFVTLTIFAALAAGTTGSDDDEKPSSDSTPAAVSEPVAVVAVDLEKLLSEYKDNELRADGQFKGKVIRVVGTVDDVKKDILDQPFVTVGTGKQFEIPQVQCSLKKAAVSKAANLTKGAKVTVVGKVRGLMMNVQLDECDVE